MEQGSLGHLVGVDNVVRGMGVDGNSVELLDCVSKGGSGQVYAPMCDDRCRDGMMVKYKGSVEECGTALMLEEDMVLNERGKRGELLRVGSDSTDSI